MHTLAVQLAPILGAEKSKVPFYIAGGVLVAWALFVSLGLGMRRPDFPASAQSQRAVMAISAVLVIAAVATAVITSGGKKDEAAAATPAQTTTEAAAVAPPAETATEATSTPTATTGTPAPSSSPAAPAATALQLAADPGGQLSYDTTALTAKAGQVTITMTNSSPVEHDVAIAEGSKVLGQTPTFAGGTKKLTLALRPGKYTFYCTVPGHRQAGMEGTLTVS